MSDLLKSEKKEHTIESLGAKIAYGIIALILIPVNIIWMGFVYKVVWNYFMPLIYNLPVLTSMQAYATALVVIIFTSGLGYLKYKDSKLVTHEDYIKSFIYPYLFGGVLLLLSYIIKYFI